MSIRLGGDHGKEKYCLDPCLWPLFPFDPGAKCRNGNVGAPNLFLGLHDKQSLALDKSHNQILCTSFIEFLISPSKDPWLYSKYVLPWREDVYYCANSNPHVMKILCLFVLSLVLQGSDLRSNPFQEGGDDTSQMAALAFDDILQSHYVKNQALVIWRGRYEHAIGQTRVWKIVWTLEDLRTLGLDHTCMVGSLPPEIGNLKATTLIDLSMNQFSNRIPREIGGLQNLENLSLRHNKLQGAIPDSISTMVGLEFLDLSHNNISRIIRKSLEKLQNLKKGKRAPPQTDALSAITRERISYYELIQATDALSESNLIGSGSFSSVYKGVLRSGTAIAVEVFNLLLDAAFKSFDTECEVLRSLRQRNLIKVITSCSNLNFKALVLEYMPNGSLEKYLYSQNYFLDIKQRLSIMIDVACALEYLHHGCTSALIHCGLKPSNVLLDEDMVAHLNDFGISKLIGEDESDLYTKTLATSGYIAPEYGLDGFISTKCDVYSYGIMLLETFTRRRPNEFEGDISLKQWVSYSLQEAVMDVIDANLVTPTGKGLQKELDVVASIMNVALYCCAESPARWTNMKGVLRSGTAIAVKVFNLQLSAAFKSFDTECEVLHRLRHRNLVKVITSCSNLDFKALVLEYMPNGSLDKHLYSHNYFLDIRRRLRIMIDVTCALEYLHHGCLLPVIHCDMKPSSVAGCRYHCHVAFQNCMVKIRVIYTLKT
ncbi:hypothetical protein T459_11355 [Capsicum annuum]|uniref:non-specific serine/threonine protein kinase n=1 Tax=Capsicum annuum TaxID=4072 RepID=A0A2G2ZLQ0_CAPAN|nr:hypothetical protein T459_11355 [Capsicum annuum]